MLKPSVPSPPAPIRKPCRVSVSLQALTVAELEAIAASRFPEGRFANAAADAGRAGRASRDGHAGRRDVIRPHHDPRPVLAQPGAPPCLRRQPRGRTPAGLEGVQPVDRGQRRRRRLARDVPRRGGRAREHLRRHAAVRARLGREAGAGGGSGAFGPGAGRRRKVVRLSPGGQSEGPGPVIRGGRRRSSGAKCTRAGRRRRRCGFPTAASCGRCAAAVPSRAPSPRARGGRDSR